MPSRWTWSTVGARDFPCVLELDTSSPIWGHFFTVSPLVVIGTLNLLQLPNLAPKHMAGPLSWENYFGFVCAPSHQTLKNLENLPAFSVSYPRPDQLLLAALAASPRDGECSKNELMDQLPIQLAGPHQLPVLKDSYLQLHCRLTQEVEIGPNVLVIGQIEQAWVHAEARRCSDEDDQDRIRQSPLLAYLNPGRYAILEESQAFPFPDHFRR